MKCVKKIEAGEKRVLRIKNERAADLVTNYGWAYTTKNDWIRNGRVVESDTNETE